jgi:hypothetical protein
MGQLNPSTIQYSNFFVAERRGFYAFLPAGDPSVPCWA